jgi:hypothetical protein
MKIGTSSGSYLLMPYITRVSVGDVPVTEITTSRPNEGASAEDDLRPYPVSTYGRDGSSPQTSNMAALAASGKKISVFA